jgi:hypothetical protein
MDRQSEKVGDLVERLAKVTAAVGYVQAVGSVSFKSTNYKYATQKDLINAVREHFAQHGLAVTMNVTDVEQVETRTEKYGKQEVSADWRCMVEFTLRYQDQWIACSCPGFGQGDKGLYAAITGASKYWLRTTFLIATGKDPEEYDNQREQEHQRRQTASRETPQRKPQQAQQRTPAKKTKHTAPKSDPRTALCERHAKALTEINAFTSPSDALSAVKRAAVELAKADGIESWAGITLEHIDQAAQALADEMNQ